MLFDTEKYRQLLDIVININHTDTYSKLKNINTLDSEGKAEQHHIDVYYYLPFFKISHHFDIDISNLYPQQSTH